MGKVPPRVPGRNAFPASPHGGAAGGAQAIYAVGGLQTISTTTDTLADLTAFSSTTPGATAFSFDSVNNEIDIAEAGLYDLRFVCHWIGNSVGVRRFRFNWSGVMGTGSTVPVGGSGDAIYQSASDMWDMSAGDTISVYVHQSSGGNLDVGGMQLSVIKIA